MSIYTKAFILVAAFVLISMALLVLIAYTANAYLEKTFTTIPERHPLIHTVY